MLVFQTVIMETKMNKMGISVVIKKSLESPIPYTKLSIEKLDFKIPYIEKIERISGIIQFAAAFLPRCVFLNAKCKTQKIRTNVIARRKIETFNSEKKTAGEKLL